MDFAPELITALRNAKSIAVLSGAGVSAESGVPTFRDALTGLWAKFNPEELATPPRAPIPSLCGIGTRGGGSR